MECPECQSTHINKNGQKKGKQNYICVYCGRQFIDCYETYRGYSDELRDECLKMYVNGMGLRGISRVKKVHHTTIINSMFISRKTITTFLLSWRNSSSRRARRITDIIRLKKNQIWVWTAVNHFKKGILEWVIENCSGKTFYPLWEQVKKWECYFYVTNGWKVYANAY